MFWLGEDGEDRGLGLGANLEAIKPAGFFGSDTFRISLLGSAGATGFNSKGNANTESVDLGWAKASVSAAGLSLSTISVDLRGVSGEALIGSSSESASSRRSFDCSRLRSDRGLASLKSAASLELLNANGDHGFDGDESV